MSVAISHHTASIDQLAQVSLGREQCRELAAELTASEVLNEAVVLSTCNRTEILLDATRFHAGLDAVITGLSAATQIPSAELPALCSVAYDELAIAHTFALAAGLDSLVVGENQILGQLRAALSDAQAAHTSGPVLNGVVQQALRVGKRVHSETRIGTAGRSVFSASIDAARAAGVEIQGRSCLVVGAGQMAGLAARELSSQGASVTLINRTYASAQRLAHEVGGQARPFHELNDALDCYDLVVTCTGAGGRLISAQQLHDRVPQAIIDLALPGDVDPNVRQRGVVLVNLASLAAGVDGTAAAEPVGVAAAKTLVHDEVAKFLARQRSAAVTPTVVALRQMADRVVDDEIVRLNKRLPNLDETTRAEVLKAIHRVADKLMHAPTVGVRAAAQAEPEGSGVDYAAVLRTLFALDAAS